jgi:hypothetical protein
MMARGPYKFKQRDITRALKGARADSYDVARIKITRDGSIVLHHDDERPDEKSALEAWEEKRKNARST